MLDIYIERESYCRKEHLSKFLWTFGQKLGN